MKTEDQNQFLASLGCKYRIGEIIKIEDGRTHEIVETPVREIRGNLRFAGDNGVSDQLGFFMIHYEHHYGGPRGDLCWSSEATIQKLNPRP